jgi:hypothetical protein
MAGYKTTGSSTLGGPPRTFEANTLISLGGSQEQISCKAAPRCAEALTWQSEKDRGTLRKKWEEREGKQIVLKWH